MADFNQNLWAPWRMQYIRSLSEEQTDDGCFLCGYWDQPDRDPENHVVWRSGCSFAVLNRFPYTNGHLLVAAASHKGDFADLSEDELACLNRAVRDAVAVLRAALGPHGFNIGYNLGRCAGAGLPDHLHAHVVPRWSGDTNYMAVIGNSRVIPDSLDAMWTQLVEHARAAGLRS